MITAAQLRAARALLGIDQRELAAQCGLSVPTIQRMEASEGVIRGNVDSLMKLVAALDSAGIELIGEGLRANPVAAACGSRSAPGASLRSRRERRGRWPSPPSSGASHC
jgi:transcriptional regulator with XRE-family HTH domain